MASSRRPLSIIGDADCAERQIISCSARCSDPRSQIKSLYAQSWRSSWTETTTKPQNTVSNSLAYSPEYTSEQTAEPFQSWIHNANDPHFMIWPVLIFNFKISLLSEPNKNE